MALHVAGHAVGPVLAAGSLAKDIGQLLGIRLDKGIIQVLLQQMPERFKRGVAGLLLKPVVNRNAFAAIGHQPGLAQAGQVGRHAGLGQAGNLGQFGNGEFFGVQQGQQAQTRGVPQQAAMTTGRIQIDKYIPLSRLKDISILSPGAHRFKCFALSG